jgi:putative ABC transport system permease protein
MRGSWVTSSNDLAECLLGRNAARQLGVAPGAQIQLEYLDRSARFRVSGVVDSGGAEDNQVFINLPAAQKLVGLPSRIELVELSVSGSASSIGRYAAQLASSLPEYRVRPIRQVTEAEGGLLNRTRLLIDSMIALIFVLTALCVLATMAALAMERRKDVGLMKALGGSIARIVGLFIAEVGVLGAAGGIIGCFGGVVLARWMGERVFGASITVRWETFPLTIAMMVLTAMAGAFPLGALGRVKPAVILRGE